MQGEARFRRLRWLCRRGMKELDVILERFLEANSTKLIAGAWPEFEEFLSLEDDILWDCFQKERIKKYPEYQELIDSLHASS